MGEKSDNTFHTIELKIHFNLFDESFYINNILIIFALNHDAVKKNKKKNTLIVAFILMSTSALNDIF